MRAFAAIRGRSGASGERSPRQLSSQARVGLVSTSITVVIVASIILLNVVGSLLVERYPISIDLTSNKAFELSDVSVQYLRALTKDVQIIVLADEPTFSGSNAYYRQAYEVIRKYAQQSAHIKLRFVDLAVNPTVAAQYTSEQVNVGDILVVCGNQVKRLDAYDLFDIEYSWDSFASSITASKAEQAMTSAILSVTSDDKPLVALLTGHDEADTAAFSDLLEQNGYQVAEVSPLTEEIPADARVVLMVAPMHDLTQDEIQKLQRHLENDGNYGRHFLYFASLNQEPLPGIEGWLAQWGISIQPGAVVETRANRVMGNNAYYGLVEPVDATLTAQMSSSELPLILPLARPLALRFTSSMGYATQVLLQYSETAGIADENTTSLSDVQVSGPITVAARGTYAESSVIVYGSEYLIDVDLLQSPSVGNESYILSVLGTLCQREEPVQIPSKTIGGSTFMIEQSQILILGAAFVLLLPLATLGTGLAVWLRRRRL